MNILMTGATGFVGRALLHKLCEVPDDNVVALSRRTIEDAPTNSKFVISEGFSVPEANLSLLKDIDVVVHCGARAHQMHDDPHTCLEEYRRVNVLQTAKLAKQAVEANVKRFIYISSIKVAGELTEKGRVFNAEDTPEPVDPYGVSKMEAERELQRLAAASQMELVIIRPVLVYGPGVKANFLTLISLINRRVPLPFARVRNKRSFVYLGNLVEFIKLCLVHPAAANNVFLISDGEDLSTPGLVSKISAALGRSTFLIPMPVRLMSLCAIIFGRRAITIRLFSSLQVDVSKNSVLLNWEPPYSVDQGIENTVKAYIENSKA
ncbi:NAD-dependent epimerase/dehydratase family protein [Pseudomonas sp. NPDC087614]|uniref:NAD-dependent epimerase/dehydratase family protein n=1 Tax=Pseudomonas sp. NPDC087614 TaxID=3364442 RepID=UPI00380AB94E